MTIAIKEWPAENIWESGPDSLSLWCHSTAYIEAIARHEGENHRLLSLEDDGEVIGLVTVADRRFRDSVDLYTPYGCQAAFSAGFEPACLDAIKAYSLAKGYTTAYLFIRPMVKGPFEWNAEISEASRYWLVPLLSAGENRVLLKKNVRNASGKRFTDQVRIIVGDSLDTKTTESLFGIYDAMVRDRDASATYFFSQETFAALLCRPNCRIGLAPLDGPIEAFAVFGQGRNTVEYGIAARRGAKPDYSAAIIWSAMLQAISEGKSLMCLGGGISPGDSLDWFKSRFGGLSVPQLCAKMVFDHDKFNRLSGEAGNEARFFPPYFAKRNCC